MKDERWKEMHKMQRRKEKGGKEAYKHVNSIGIEGRVGFFFNLIFHAMSLLIMMIDTALPL